MTDELPGIRRCAKLVGLAPIAHMLSMVLLAVAFAVSRAEAKSTEPLPGIDAEIQDAMTRVGVPGVAVGVIRDGHVILARGYGVREAGRPERVNADTLFSIASLSKSFTTGVMAMLVDEGKLDWDKPVRQYLPWFELADPLATQLLTSRDLVAHRTGLASHGFLRFSTYLQPAELTRRLRYLPSNRSFRERYQYNTIMYGVAGYLAGEVAGSSWSDLVKRRIFQPVGMTHSTTSVLQPVRPDNRALPHQKDKGKVGSIAFYDYMKFGIAPGGSIGSTVNDMLKYLQMYLDGGKAAGTQLISSVQVNELLRPVVPTDDSGAYALGWRLSMRQGQRYIGHGGSIMGFTAHMTLLPQSRIGIIVLNNLGESHLPQLLADYLAGRLLGAVAKGSLVLPPEQVFPDPELPKRVVGTRPSLELDAYAGEYFHPAYGVVRVERHGANLIIRFDALQLLLEHYHYDTFYSRGYGWQGLGLYQFQLDTAGRVAQLLAPLEQTVPAFVFVRR